jgi:Ribonuclease G/E
MSSKMLINAVEPEEYRVAILKDGDLEAQVIRFILSIGCPGTRLRVTRLLPEQKSL